MSNEQQPISGSTSSSPVGAAAPSIASVTNSVFPLHPIAAVATKQEGKPYVKIITVAEMAAGFGIQGKKVNLLVSPKTGKPFLNVEGTSINIKVAANVNLKDTASLRFIYESNDKSSDELFSTGGLTNVDLSKQAQVKDSMTL